MVVAKAEYYLGIGTASRHLRARMVPVPRYRERRMAEQKSGPVELGAAMDYAAHEKTYNGFLALAKYGTLACVVLMIAMAVGFFMGGGFFGGFLVFVILNIAGFVLLK